MRKQYYVVDFSRLYILLLITFGILFYSSFITINGIKYTFYNTNEYMTYVYKKKTQSIIVQMVLVVKTIIPCARFGPLILSANNSEIFPVKNFQSESSLDNRSFCFYLYRCISAVCVLNFLFFMAVEINKLVRNILTLTCLTYLKKKLYNIYFSSD